MSLSLDVSRKTTENQVVMKMWGRFARSRYHKGVRVKISTSAIIRHNFNVNYFIV